MIQINSITSLYSEQKLVGDGSTPLYIEADGGDIEPIVINMTIKVNKFKAFSASMLRIQATSSCIQSFTYSSTISTPKSEGDLNVYTVETILNLNVFKNMSTNTLYHDVYLTVTNVASMEELNYEEAIQFVQPSMGVEELAQIRMNATSPRTPLKAQGSTTEEVFVKLYCDYIDPNSIKIIFDNAPKGWGDDFEYRITTDSTPGLNVNVTVYLKHYKGNYLSTPVNAVLVVTGNSTLTGNTITKTIYNETSKALEPLYIKRQNGTTGNLNAIIQPQDLLFYFKGGVRTIIIHVDSPNDTPLTSFNFSSDSQAITVTDKVVISDNDLQVKILCTGGEVEVQGKITVTSTYQSSTKTNYITYKRTEAPGLMYLAAWQDFELEVNSKTEGYSTLKIEDAETEEVIYEGSIFNSSSYTPSVNITPIISKYVESNIYFIDSTYDFDGNSLVCNFKTNKYFIKDFYVYIDGEITNYIHLYYNWSFNNDFFNVLTTNRLSNISQPIQNVIHGKQYIFMSRYFLDDTYLEDMTNLYFYPKPFLPQGREYKGVLQRLRSYTSAQLDVIAAIGYKNYFTLSSSAAAPTDLFVTLWQATNNLKWYVIVSEAVQSTSQLVGITIYSKICDTLESANIEVAKIQSDATHLSVINASITSGGNCEHSITRLKDSKGVWQDWVDTAELKFNGSLIKKYKVCWCNEYKYCLYYINAYGGIDWYLFNSTSKETNNNSFSNYETKQQNTGILHSIKNYQNVIKRKFELHSDLMNNEQSELFKDIFGSPVCYLQDLQKDLIIPVNISSTSYDIKTFKSNGKKLINYTVNVEEARSRVYRF